MRETGIRDTGDTVPFSKEFHLLIPYRACHMVSAACCSAGVGDRGEECNRVDQHSSTNLCSIGRTCLG